MDKIFLYLVVGVLSSMYIIFPILGKVKNSIEISTFLLSIGFGGYALSKKKLVNGISITREKFLNKSLKLQMTVCIANILYSTGCYLLKINPYVMFIIIGMLNIIAEFAIWTNLKRYEVK